MTHTPAEMREMADEIDPGEKPGYQNARTIASMLRQAADAMEGNSTDDWPRTTELVLALVPPNIYGVAFCLGGSWYWPEEGDNRPAIGVTRWWHLPKDTP